MKEKSRCLPARRFLLRNIFERKHLVRSARRDRPHPTTAVIDPVSARYLVKRRRLWRTGWGQRVISGIEETRDHYPSVNLTASRLVRFENSLPNHQHDAIPRTIRVVGQLAGDQQKSIAGVVPGVCGEISVHDNRHRMGGTHRRGVGHRGTIGVGTCPMYTSAFSLICCTSAFRPPTVVKFGASGET